MEILKMTKTKRNDGWVSVTEMPNNMIALEGIRVNPKDETILLTQRILFSKEAIELIAPALIKWLKNK